MSTSFALPGQSNTLQSNVNRANNNGGGATSSNVASGSKDLGGSSTSGNEVGKVNDQASLAAGLTTVNGIVPTLQ